jgi:hypothetical protein
MGDVLGGRPGPDTLDGATSTIATSSLPRRGTIFSRERCRDRQRHQPDRGKRQRRLVTSSRGGALVDRGPGNDRIGTGAPEPESGIGGAGHDTLIGRFGFGDLIGDDLDIFGAPGTDLAGNDVLGGGDLLSGDPGDDTLALPGGLADHSLIEATGRPPGPAMFLAHPAGHLISQPLVHLHEEGRPCR